MRLSRKLILEKLFKGHWTALCHAYDDLNHGRKNLLSYNTIKEKMNDCVGHTVIDKNGVFVLNSISFSECGDIDTNFQFFN